MRSSHNEQGYALLIVLFLVVFIMAVSAVFMRGAISNAKQETQVDENHLTVMAAEAGVEYTKRKLMNAYYNKIEEINEFASNSIANTPKGQSVNYKEIQITAYNMMFGHLKDELSGVDREIEKPFSFKLISKSLIPSDDKKTISYNGEIKGLMIEEGEEIRTKTITFTLEFKIPDFSKSSVSETTDLALPNMHRLYPDNVSEKSNCFGDKIKNKNCIGQDVEYKSIEESNVYFPIKLIKPNANLQVTKSNLYFKDGIKIENFNQVKQSKLYIDGAVEVKNMNGVNDSSLYLNGNLKVNSNMKMSNSIMPIRGAAHFLGGVNLSKNSLVCITGSAQFDKELKLEKGSKLVHWGALVAYGGISGSGEIIQAWSEQDVWDKCAGEGNSKIDWETPIIRDVKY